MSPDIVTEQTRELARELAALAGESLAEAVTVAVRERLDRLHAREGLDEARLVAARSVADGIARRLVPHAELPR